MQQALSLKCLFLAQAAEANLEQVPAGRASLHDESPSSSPQAPRTQSETSSGLGPASKQNSSVSASSKLSRCRHATLLPNKRRAILENNPLECVGKPLTHLFLLPLPHDRLHRPHSPAHQVKQPPPPSGQGLTSIGLWPGWHLSQAGLGQFTSLLCTPGRSEEEEEEELLAGYCWWHRPVTGGGGEASFGRHSARDHSPARQRAQGGGREQNS